MCSCESIWLFCVYNEWDMCAQHTHTLYSVHIYTHTYRLMYLQKYTYEFINAHTQAQAHTYIETTAQIYTYIPFDHIKAVKKHWLKTHWSGISIELNGFNIFISRLYHPYVLLLNITFCRCCCCCSGLWLITIFYFAVFLFLHITWNTYIVHIISCALSGAKFVLWTEGFYFFLLFCLWTWLRIYEKWSSSTFSSLRPYSTWGCTRVLSYSVLLYH